MRTYVSFVTAVLLPNFSASHTLNAVVTDLIFFIKKESLKIAKKKSIKLGPPLAGFCMQSQCDFHLSHPTGQIEV